MELFIIFVVLVVVFLLFYIYIVFVVLMWFLKLENKSICFLIVYLDDEVMFFVFIVFVFMWFEIGNYVKIFCLSSGVYFVRVFWFLYKYWYFFFDIGDVDGLGEIWKKELVKFGVVFGLWFISDVFVVEKFEFCDSMIMIWDVGKILDFFVFVFVF